MKRSLRSLLLLPLILALAFLAALGTARPAYAANCDDDHRVMGNNFTLAKGEELDSNLIVLGGNATIEPGAILNCTLVTLGGDVDVAGSVAEDMVVIGGNVELRSTAVIGGQLVTFGGSIDREDGAQVKGGESQGFGVSGDEPRTGFRLPGRFAPFTPLVDLYRSLLHTVLVSIGLGLLALLVVLFWPEQTARVGAAVTTAPAAAGGLGLLTVVAVPMLIVLAAITICLIPVSFVGAVVFAAALVFGWIGLGQLVGVRLAGALRLHNLSPAVSAALGTGLLTLVVSAINWVPCVGWVAPVVLAAVGLGAVTLTRFGTQAYLPSAPTTPPSPPPAEPGPLLTDGVPG
jgi:hypothetical protein